MMLNKNYIRKLERSRKGEQQLSPGRVINTLRREVGFLEDEIQQAEDKLQSDTLDRVPENLIDAPASILFNLSDLASALGDDQKSQELKQQAQQVQKLMR